ncbi:MAG: O-antigen ligase family protein [Armatimonadetes bacterium]|nr:O-antigen ligase family protein [Anaerolineae bacterium]
MSIKINWRTLPTHIGIVATFLAIPLWLRLPALPFGFAPLYVSGFMLVLPLLFTIISWFLSGMPGWARFKASDIRAGWAVALLGIALWMYGSSGWAFMAGRDPSIALSATVQFGLVALLALATACAAPPPGVIIAALIFGLVWNSALAGAQVALQSSVGLTALGEFPLNITQAGVGLLQAGDVRWLRPYGLLSHPNVLAGFMVVGLLALTDWLTSPRGRVHWLALLILIGTLWAFLLTFSRGSYLALAVGAVFLLPLLWRAKRAQHGLGTALLVAVMVGVSFFILYRPLLLARAGVGAEDIEVFSVGERALLLQTAARAISESPILGVGAGSFPWRASYYFFFDDVPIRGNNVHHVLMSVWAELGIVGLGLFVAATVLGVEAVFKHIRANDSASTERGVLLAGFIALGIIGLVDHYPYSMIQMQTLWWGILAVAMRPT